MILKLNCFYSIFAKKRNSHGHFEFSHCAMSHCFLKTHAKIDCSAPIEAFMPKFHERPSVLPCACLLAYLLACCLYPLQTKERTLNAPRRRWVDVTRILKISRLVAFYIDVNKIEIKISLCIYRIIISTWKSKKRKNNEKIEKKICVSRESNPDQLLGRQLC